MYNLLLNLFLFLFVGETLVLITKLIFWLAMRHKVVLISCLLPEDGVSPTNEVLMPEQIKQIRGKCDFFSAQDICSEMNV